MLAGASLSVKALSVSFLFGDFDGLDNHWLNWAIHTIGCSLSDVKNNLLRSCIGDLTKDGVVVVQVWGWYHGDKELGAIGSWAGIRHSQQEWAIELELRVELISKHVAWAATTGAGWIATLDHEAVDNAVEHCAIVERALVGAGSVFGLVLSGTVCQGDKVFDGLWRMVAKQLDGNVTTVGVQNRSSGLQSHAIHHKHETRNLATLDG